MRRCARWTREVGSRRRGAARARGGKRARASRAFARRERGARGNRADRRSSRGAVDAPCGAGAFIGCIRGAAGDACGASVVWKTGRSARAEEREASRDRSCSSRHACAGHDRTCEEESARYGDQMRSVHSLRIFGIASIVTASLLTMAGSAQAAGPARGAPAAAPAAPAGPVPLADALQGGQKPITRRPGSFTAMEISKARSSNSTAHTTNQKIRASSGISS